MEAHYIDSITKQFRYYKSLGDKSFAILSENDIHRRQGEEQNSIAIIAKHMAGNMLSRFTNFLTEDGEKSWRDRDSEFEDTLQTKDEMIAYWEKGWKCLFNTLENLNPEDIAQIVYIRNEGHTALEALNRQMAHYAYHIGQIVCLAKMIKGNSWISLSIPKGDSDKFNKDKFNKGKSRRHFTDDYN
ncbi:DUF1572 domain-containing protein [Zhouia spongiae]|uniref:DUF1572 domain-containing protein n=1 Tax=Zhouia spongiae TaxID=2202721 RepID=A0ABY3YLG9_9FLAO|nr:DUF1572 family protein [Zhouia spongiae]UNY98684.1 DUF1572 domain-containing protein [Zhouia spongiae]